MEWTAMFLESFIYNPHQKKDLGIENIEKLFPPLHQALHLFCQMETFYPDCSIFAKSHTIKFLSKKKTYLN